MRGRRRTSAGLGVAILCLPVAVALAQTGVTCRPVSERTSEVGCYIIARHRLAALASGPVFWHLDRYPDRAAAQAAATPSSTVAESFGAVWLLSIGPTGWRPVGGERVAEIGPLPVPAAGEYTAQFMEAVFEPGMTTNPHRHPGPEAWYLLAGEQCLETPAGVMRVRAGESMIVAGDTPMNLYATGAAWRRALVLILHDAAQRASIPVSDWAPTGLCER